MPGLADCDVIILCGGFGTRLQSIVQDRPKPMADIHGRPFLSLIVEHFLRHGARRFILCTGHRGDMIEAWFRTRRSGDDMLFTRDPTPLGTGGALAQAMSAVTSHQFLVVNGDSLCEIDPERLLRFHAVKRAAATMTITCRENRHDTGAVVLGEGDRVLSMVEKPSMRSAGYDNAGIYVFDRAIESLFPAKSPWSLERDLLPPLVTQGLYGFVTASPLYDIGTPERLAHFRQVWKETSVHSPLRSLYQVEGPTF